MLPKSFNCKVYLIIYVNYRFYFFLFTTIVGTMSRSIVTGAAGFIGSHLTERLLELGETVVGIDNFDPWYDPKTKEENIGSALGNEAFSLFRQNIFSTDLSDILEPGDVVYHLAARPGVQDSWGTGFAASVENNVLATQYVFESALTNGVRRVVFASSSSVYGASSTDDTKTVAPISPYGVSKAACEQLAEVYRTRGLDIVAMRYFTVYGPRQRPDMAMNRLFRAALPGTYRFPLRGNGSQRREFTFVDDVVDATVRAGNPELNELSRPFDVGGGVSASLGEVMSLVEDITGATLRIDHEPAAAGDPLITAASTDYTEATLDWNASTSLREGLLAHYESLREPVTSSA